MELSTQYLDVAIIGGGPAGLTAAIMLGRACKSVVVIDAGKPRNAAARQIHAVIGREGISPGTLLQQGRDEATAYGVTVLQDTVVSVELLTDFRVRHKTAFCIETESRRSVVARKILLATGVRDKLPDFEGTGECYGTSVHHCPYCDGWEHRGKRLVAYGDDADSAAGLGLSLRNWSMTVTVLTNGKRLSEGYKQKLVRNHVALVESGIVKLLHDDCHLQGVLTQDTGVIAADALFFNTEQNEQSLPTFRGFELDRENSGQTENRQRTNIPGFFLAGDAAGEVQFVSVAAAEGAIAAVAINREIQDEDCS